MYLDANFSGGGGFVEPPKRGRTLVLEVTYERSELESAALGAAVALLSLFLLAAILTIIGHGFSPALPYLGMAALSGVVSFGLWVKPFIDMLNGRLNGPT